MELKMANENGMQLLASLLKNAGSLNPAKSIIDQMRMAGQPRVSQTTMTQPDEPLDLGSIGMMLFLLFGPNGLLGGTSKTLGKTAIPSLSRSSYSPIFSGLGKSGGPDLSGFNVNPLTFS